jgi:putative tryptophan/tyrosine transport system substrate-binding protein
MKRREFIVGLGSAAAWPVVARAQQGERGRRVGVLMGYDENDPEGKAFLTGFTKGLQELGWAEGRNLLMDIRWAAANVDQMRVLAKELVGLRPDVILSSTTPVTAALKLETQTIPIVFTVVGEPVGAGFVADLPSPGGNITGFITQEASMASKWLELLTETASGLNRVAFMFNPDTTTDHGSYYRPSFEAFAQSLKVAPITAPVHSDSEIEAAITSLGREPGGGLVVRPDAFTNAHRAQIILLAARNKVPAVYGFGPVAREGGLLSYGPDRVDIFRRSASYVARILRGAKPADLPVQLPTKFEMAINLKTAKALGLTIPETLLATADEVIQ